jgi:signal transduction histidine kinase
MEPIFVGVVSAVVGLVVGILLGRGMGRGAGLEQGRREGREEGLKAGRAEARTETDRDLRTLVEAVSRGRRPEGVAAGGAVADLQRALESGWAPREQERQRALHEAIGRVGAFLDRAVRSPLADAKPGADAEELRERIQRALGALSDLDFFQKEPSLEAEGRDLPPLVQQVTREFAQDQNVGVRISLDGRPVRAKVNAPALMDALYLILHNAARFGGAATVDVTVVNEDGAAVLRVRDRGPGFTEEAFQRAFDPFYSTADDGLGLGLPHARRIVEGMGGRIDLRNVPDGGGEVAVSFPAA